MKKFLGLAAYSLLLAVSASAEEHAISQKGKVFTPVELSIKKDDTVTFVNDDTVAHNVFSQSPGSKFNLKLQKPGESTSVTFSKVGDHTVRCAIHPGMEMVVKVSE